MIRPEDAEQPVGSLDVGAMSDDEKEAAGIPVDANRGTSEDREDEQVDPEDQNADRAGEPENLSRLSKAELVQRAEEQGIDTTDKTKADLVAELEGGDGGNDGSA